MSDAASTDRVSGPPRKNLSRLRAQRQARQQGSDSGSTAGDGPAGGGAGEPSARPPAEDPAGPSRPLPAGVPRHMRARDGSTGRSPHEELSRREADRNKAMHSLAPDDLDKTALSVAEAASFLGFRFQDYTDIVPAQFPRKFDPEVGRSGECIVFVENAETGLMEAREAGFGAVAAEEDEADDEARLLGRLDGAFPGEEDPLFGWGSGVGPREGKEGAVLGSVRQALAHGSAALVIRCMYLCAQGILAGFSFVTVYSLTSFDNDEDFLVNYQSTANEARRFFYLLCTVSLAGGLDACLDVFAPSSTDVMAVVEGPVGSEAVTGPRGQAAGEKGGRQEPAAYTSTADRAVGAPPMYGMSRARGGPAILLSLMCALYLVCLLCSLVMAPQDVLIYNRNDEEGADWAKLALGDSAFKDGLDSWKSLAAVRLVCALLAWAIVCVLTWSNLAVSLRLIDLVVRLRQMVSRRRNRISQLEGDGDALAELPETRLRELIEMQRVGLQRAEQELRSRIGFEVDA